MEIWHHLYSIGEGIKDVPTYAPDCDISGIGLRVARRAPLANRAPSEVLSHFFWIQKLLHHTLRPRCTVECIVTLTVKGKEDFICNACCSCVVSCMDPSQRCVLESKIAVF
jgi:hypothetical protein